MAGIIEQRHAFLRARQQQPRKTELAAQVLRAFMQLRFAVPHADHLRQLGAVRRDDGGARIAAVVAALGVDQHRLLRCAGELDHPWDVCQAALAVVGEQHHIAQRKRCLVLRQHVLQKLVVGFILEVDANELL